MVNKDMKDAILSLQEKESNVIELKQSLQQLTEKETKFKLEQEVFIKINFRIEYFS